MATPKIKTTKPGIPVSKFKQPPVLFDKTQEMIRKIQNRLDGKLITYWNGSRGSICDNDVIALFKLLEHLGMQDTLYLFIKSDGGIYGEMGQKATTDINDTESHGNEIINILEREDFQTYYQQDKDWFYRSEERRWIVLNDASSWHQVTGMSGKVVHTKLFF